VLADLSTVVAERPEAVGAMSYGSRAAGDAALLPVENDDVATLLGRLDNGASVLIEASRVADGHPFNLGVEVFGSNGSVRFTQQDSYKLELFLRGPEPAGFTGSTTVTLGPGHGDYGAYWPFPGVTIGSTSSRPLRCATSSRRSSTEFTPTRPSRTVGGSPKYSPQPTAPIAKARGKRSLRRTPP
jgi:hypothetical protein